MTGQRSSARADAVESVAVNGPKYRGQTVDYGDVVVETIWHVKGLPVKPRSVMKWGPHLDTVPADRVPTVPQPYSPRSGEVDSIMQLQSDKRVAILGMVDLDEMGNEIGPSADQPAYTTSDAAGVYLVLADNGDGTGSIAATGVLTPADDTPTVTATFTDGSATVEAVNVVVGDVASRAFSFGPPEEVTADA